jgi:hypothetical protein
VQPAEIASLKQLTSFDDAELEAIYAIFATRHQAVRDMISELTLTRTHWRLD